MKDWVIKKTSKPETAWAKCEHGIKMRDGARFAFSCGDCRKEAQRLQRYGKRHKSPGSECHHGARMRAGAKWASKCQPCQLERMRAYWDRVGKAKRKAYWQTYYLEVIKGAGRA
jgi:hypothetical protein